MRQVTLKVDCRLPQGKELTRLTKKSAALWTDSRYFLAAEEQLEGTEYQLMRLKMEGTPTISV